MPKKAGGLPPAAPEEGIPKASAGSASDVPTTGPRDANFACLDVLESCRGDDGKLELRMTWPGTDYRPQHWKQISNPYEKRSQGVDGYEAVDCPYTGFGWGGIEAGGANSLINGSAANANWFCYALGTYAPYTNRSGSVIPGFLGPAETGAKIGNLVHCAELHVKHAGSWLVVMRQTTGTDFGYGGWWKRDWFRTLPAGALPLPAQPTTPDSVEGSFAATVLSNIHVRNRKPSPKENGTYCGLDPTDAGEALGHPVKTGVYNVWHVRTGRVGPMKFFAKTAKDPSGCHAADGSKLLTGRWNRDFVAGFWEVGDKIVFLDRFEAVPLPDPERVKLFHGTNGTFTEDITSTGLRMSQPPHARIGVGVYFTPDFETAKQIALFTTGGNRKGRSPANGYQDAAVFECEVVVGRQYDYDKGTAYANGKLEPKCKWWANVGFGSAFSKPEEGTNHGHPPWAGVKHHFHEVCVHNVGAVDIVKKHDVGFTILHPCNPHCRGTAECRCQNEGCIGKDVCVAACPRCPHALKAMEPEPEPEP